MAGLFQKGEEMYQAELFYNTGFNAVNIPDSENTLRAAASSIKIFPALDILQPTALTSVRLKATYAQVVGADYLLLRNQDDSNLFCFYSIASAPVMSSADVANLGIVEDPILTAGGISNLQFLDGITSRHHVATADDTFGAYIEEDPYLSLTKTPIYDVKKIFTSNDPAEYGWGHGPLTVVTSMLDLDDAIDGIPMTTYGSGEITGAGVNWNISSTPEQVPDLKELINGKETNFATIEPDFSYMQGFSTGDNHYGQIDGVIQSPYIYGYVDNKERNIVAFGIHEDLDSDVTTSINRLVSIDMGGAILDAAIIPGGYIVPNRDINDPYEDGYLQHSGSDIGCLQATGAFYTAPSDGAFAYEYDDTIVNKRVLYGKYNSYKLISSATGSSTQEYFPEDFMYRPGLLTGTNNSLTDDDAPVPVALPDIRINGRPYFNFAYTKNCNNQFFTGAASGAQWRKPTLTVSVKSGAYLEEANFRRSQTEKDFWSSDEGLYITQGGDAAYTGELALAKADIDNFYKGGMSAVTNTMNTATTKGSEAALGTAASGAVGMLTGAMMNKANQKATYAYNDAVWQAHLKSIADGDSNYYRAVAGDPLALGQYEREREKNVEIASFLQSVNIFDPGFKINTDSSLRDIAGNGAYFVRKRPSATDRARHDRILSQFGYKITEPITAAMLTNRNKFNYIQAGGVSVNFITSTYYGKYLKERVAEVFANGVRIWHVKPNVAHYVPGANT